MKKLLMILAMGLTLSSVGLARDRADFRPGKVEVVRVNRLEHGWREGRREHRRHHRHHRHDRRDWR